MSKRNDLLAAAKTLLWERGREAVSLGGLSEQPAAGRPGGGRAGVRERGPGFIPDMAADLGSSPDLAVGEELRTLIDQVFSPVLDPLERLRGYLMLPRDGLTGCRLDRLAVERAIFERETSRPVAAFFAFLRQRIREALAEAKVRHLLPASLSEHEASVALIAVVQGGYMLSRIHGDPELLQAAVRGALEQLALLAGAGGGQGRAVLH